MNKLNKKTLLELSIAINAWAQQFKVNISKIGIIEEIGEMAHCIAKREQGIRGFDVPSHFRKEFTDALADIGIYTLHACASYKVDIKRDIHIDTSLVGEWNKAQTPKDKQALRQEVIGELCVAAGTFALPGFSPSVDEGLIVEIFQACLFLAFIEDINLELEIAHTWNKVSKRNWVGNPVSAHQEAGHGAEVAK